MKGRLYVFQYRSGEFRNMPHEELLHPEKYIQLLLESTDQGIYGLDTEGHCILVNRSAARMFGYEPEDLQGKELHSLIHHSRVDGSPYPQDDCPIFLAFRKGLGTRVDSEVFWRRDGTTFPVEYSSNPIIEDGVVKGAVVAFIDISERKRAEEELQKAHDEMEMQVEVRTAELAGVNEELRLEIEERMQFEEDLRSANDKLRIFARIFEHSPDFMSVLDRQYTYRMVNPTYLRMFERTSDQIIGHTVPELLGNDLFQTLLKPRLDRCLAGEVAGYESWITVPAGHRFLSTHYYPLFSDGQVEYVVVVARDITDRKLAEDEREHVLAQLEVERGRLEEVLRQMPAGVVIAEAPTGRLILGNEQMSRIFRHPFIPSADIKQYVEWKVYHLDGRPLEPEEHPLARSINNGEIVAGEELNIKRGDGSWGVILGNSAPIRDQSGDIISAVAAFIDITEVILARKQIEQLAELAQRQAAELKSVLDNMVDGVLVCNVDKMISLTNEAEEQLLGIPGLAKLNRPIRDLVGILRIRHPNGKQVAYEELPLVRALAGETVTMEDNLIFNRWLGKDVLLRVNAAPIKDEKGVIVGAVAVSRDVTELAELDHLKDQFIATAAHELKTPVTIMKGYAQSLLRDTGDIAPTRRRSLEAIDRGAGRINNIVNDLLDVSRLLSGHLELEIEPIDLPDFVQQVIDHISFSLAKHRIQLIKSEPVVIHGDRYHLEQVLVNLLDNAVRYSPRGGDVNVEVAVRDGEGVVSVQDQGIGIPKDKQGRIFERFYRAHTGTPYDYGGMGVGLYISREIVNRHGGRMWFDSTEGEGSKFYISLPI